MVDLLLITTIVANLATVITLIVSVYSLKKEVVKYSNNFQNIQNSIVEYIKKIQINNVQINNSVLSDVNIRNNARVGINE